MLKNISHSRDGKYYLVTGDAYVGFKSHNKAPYKMTIKYEDTGTQLTAIEIVADGMIYKPRVNKYKFKEFTIAQCATSTILGRAKSLFKEEFKPRLSN